jgi:hypothetical protein
MVVHDRAREGRRQHKVRQLGVKFERKLDRLLHRLFGVAGHPKDKEAHRLQIGRFGIGEGFAHLIERLPLANDVAQHVLVAIFHAEADALAARRLHQLE